VGINALVHKGINAFVLCILWDLTHNKFTDSIIGGIAAPLSNGPVYFDCFPNFSTSVTDETLADILKLQILTTGFDMRGKRQNIGILAKGCFWYTNTMYPAILHTPSPDSMTSTLVMTDAINQKVEHSSIRWETLEFPTDWVTDTPKVPLQRAITSAQIKESDGSIVLSFPSSPFSRSQSWPKPTRLPPPVPSFCTHNSLHSLIEQVGDVPLSVQCPDCKELVSLSTMTTCSSKANLHFQHELHNPRTNKPPPASNSKEVFPHPQCSDIPFPHNSHILVIDNCLEHEINERLLKPFSKNLRQPSRCEIKRYLRMAKGCPKHLVSESWMKNMMNWDLYTHPRSEVFAKITTIEEKIELAKQWKIYMEDHQVYLSFYEWYYTNLKLSAPLTPVSAPLIACPIKTLSLSDLGKELQELKKKQKQEEEEAKAQECKLQHQQFHVLIDLRIQDLNFRLKTLIDTGSDLNLLHK
jgi:hypothetical protein